MEIEINLDPEKIEQAVISAITSSALGDALNDIIEREVAALARFDGSLSRAIKQEVQRIVLHVIRDEYSERIKNAAREHLTDETVQKVTDAAMDALFDKLME